MSCPLRITPRCTYPSPRPLKRNSLHTSALVGLFRHVADQQLDEKRRCYGPYLNTLRPPLIAMSGDADTSSRSQPLDALLTLIACYRPPNIAPCAVISSVMTERTWSSTSVAVARANSDSMLATWSAVKARGVRTRAARAHSGAAQYVAVSVDARSARRAPPAPARARGGARAVWVSTIDGVAETGRLARECQTRSIDSTDSKASRCARSRGRS